MHIRVATREHAYLYKLAVHFQGDCWLVVCMFADCVLTQRTLSLFVRSLHTRQAATASGFAELNRCQPQTAPNPHITTDAAAQCCDTTRESCKAVGG